MLALLRRRPAFARLWAAGAVSLFGDWLSLVAVSVLAGEGRGGALALAAVLTAHSLPSAVASPVAGVLADRISRRTLLLSAALVQAVLTLAMAIAAARGSAFVVGTVLLLRSTVAAMVPPAETAALPSLVAPGELLAANALVAGTWSVAYVGGMAAGGALATVGPALCIAIDATTFCVSAALLATLPPLEPPPRAVVEPVHLRAIVRDLGAGIRFARERPWVLRAALSKAPVAIASGGGWLALNLFARDVHPLASAALSLGTLQAMRGLGTLVGPAMVTAFARRNAPRARLMTVSNATAFVAVLAFALVAERVPLEAVFAAALAWGTGSGSNWVLSQSALQEQTDRAYLGRLSSLDELAATVAMCVGAALTGLFVTLGSSRGEAASMMVVLGLVAWGALVTLPGRAPAGLADATGERVS